MTFRIVGIGASAGGLEAVSEFLSALATENDMAYVVVQHLERTHGSLLPEILAKQSSLTVAPATDGEPVRRGHVYVIPPNATLTVADGHLHLTERPPGGERHYPVDALFESLAIAYRDDAIGIVLSGGDADGSRGIQAIKREGGVVFAQTPETAQVPSMPRNAIATGCVDLVLRPKEIAHALARLAHYGSYETLPDDATSAAERPGAGQPTSRSNDGFLGHILSRVRTAHGIDFTHYKRSMLLRRIDRRMLLRGITNRSEYSALIDTDPVEVTALHQDFLIRVTEFFRDPESFDALREHVFPALAERAAAQQSVRIWVPGCATGEEVYSLAIALVEHLGDTFAPDRVQIFGTDVHEAALEQARAGLYSSDALRNVAAERVNRFFVSQEKQLRVAREIREVCVFARQDVTRDPPFSRLDFISCRNLLIYLDEVAQRRVLQVFHFALRSGGMVLFGPAESVGQPSELFEPADARIRLYRRRPGAGARSTVFGAATSENKKDQVPAPAESESLATEADRLLLARYAPASLLVDEQLNILQFRGRTGPFLEPVGGRPSFELRRVLRPELLVELLPAIQEARETDRSVRREGLRLDASDVSLEVVPMTGSRGTSAYVILMDDGAGTARGGRGLVPLAGLPESEKDRRFAQLQREAVAMREYLDRVTREHSAVTEELRSAHEELMSSNEEFQSTNEELETSKEELQSTNEELTTTNDELQSRNRDLATLNTELERERAASERARTYADVIIETVREPLAVIDSELKIRRVNQSFLTEFQMTRETVEGQLLREAQGGLWSDPALQQRLRAAFRDGEPITNWELTQERPALGRRVVSLSARKIPGDEERSDLVLVAADDVTDRANATADLLANNRHKDEFLATLGHDLRHPLTPIAHAIHILRQRKADEETTALYETIDTQVQVLLRFVEESLDLARISRSLVQVRREPLDLDAIVRQSVETFNPLIQSRGHKLTVRLPDAPLRMSGDPVRLNQVVTNLIENAAKYTPLGGEITLALEQQGADAVLTVRDTGIGIAPEHLELVFDLFAQINRAGARNGGGLGLGLSIVRRVVELHGGRIQARSAGLGKGSEFIARIPVQVEQQAPDPPPFRPVSRRMIPASGDAATHPKRVLVVDDHEEITASVERLVRLFGHEVAVASDGPSALALAASFKPNCAILDIELSGMSGYELARRLRELFPADRLRLIALTGSSGAKTRDECRAAGFDACLIKPGEIDELEELLARDLPGPVETSH